MKQHELADRQAAHVRHHLKELWNVDPREYWYPLALSPRSDLLAFHAPAFHDMWSSGIGITMLQDRGIEQVFELREGGQVFELRVIDLDPEYTGDEGYWSSTAFDWIIYASHESSITIGGQWFVTQVKAMWPSWKMHMWMPPCGE